jgi:hypothetical protein
MTDTPLSRTLIDDEMYPLLLADAVRDGHLTYAEATQQNELHKLVEPACDLLGRGGENSGPR